MRKLAFALPLTLALAGCQTLQTHLTATAGPEPLVCTQWLPISYASKHDTADTVAGVRANNGRRKAYCAVK